MKEQERETMETASLTHQAPGGPAHPEGAPAADRAPDLDGDMVEYLIRAYQPLVRATARRMCPEDPKDEDLLQCGTIGLWRAAERWDQTRPFGALARPCVESAMANYLRGKRGKRAHRTAPLEGAKKMPCREEDWDGIFTRELIAQRLPEGSRQRALLLALCDGVSLSQAAKRLGLRRGRARRMAERACKRHEIL